MSPIAAIEDLRRASELGWEMAVDTAGAEYPGGSDERAEKMRSMADGCDDAYAEAVAALERGDVEAAIESLEQARGLESDGGDSSHASSALALLGAS